MAELKREYYSSGELLSEVYMINGKKEGVSKNYYKNGQIEVITNYVNDKKNGHYKEYFDEYSNNLFKNIYKKDINIFNYEF